MTHTDTDSLHQGMYKNWVKNNRNNCEIPALLSCKQGNPERETSKLFVYYFEFSRSGFPYWEDKRVAISKIFLSFFTLFLYTPLIHSTDSLHDYFECCWIMTKI